MIRFLALALLLGSRLAFADVYVWTDQDGRRQISDVVPEKYRNRAKKVDVPMQPEQPRQEETRAPASAAAGGSAAPAETTEIVADPPGEFRPGISTK